MAAPVTVRVQRDDFDIAAEVSALCRARTDVGAVVTFSGLCRDEAGALSALELEHYPGMAEAEIERICHEAVERFGLQAATAIHRFGRMEPGANIVLVVTPRRTGRRHSMARFHHGFPEDLGPLLEEGTSRRRQRRRLGQREGCGRRGTRSLDAPLISHAA